MEKKVGKTPFVFLLLSDPCHCVTGCAISTPQYSSQLQICAVTYCNGWYKNNGAKWKQASDEGCVGGVGLYFCTACNTTARRLLHVCIRHVSPLPLSERSRLIFAQFDTPLRKCNATQCDSILRFNAWRSTI